MFAVVIMTLVTFWVQTISVKSRKRVKWTVKNVGVIVIIAQLYLAKNGAVLNNNRTHGWLFFYDNDDKSGSWSTRRASKYMSTQIFKLGVLMLHRIQKRLLTMIMTWNCYENQLNNSSENSILPCKILLLLFVSSWKTQCNVSCYVFWNRFACEKTYYYLQFRYFEKRFLKYKKWQGWGW